MTKLEKLIDKTLESLEMQVFLDGDITRFNFGQLVTIGGVIYETEYDCVSDPQGFVLRHIRLEEKMENKRKQFVAENKEEREKRIEKFISSGEYDRLRKLFTNSTS